MYTHSIRTIDINWTGPFQVGSSLVLALEKFPHAGVFQIYGPDLGSQQQLLYLGILGTPLHRIFELSRTWMPYEVEELNFYLGYPDSRVVEDVSLGLWKKSMEVVQQLLVSDSQPLLNEPHESADAAPILVVNHGSRMLLPERVAYPLERRNLQQLSL